MKKLTKIFYCSVALIFFVILVVGCTGGTNEASNTNTSEDESTSPSQSETKTDDTEDSKQIDKKKEESESITETEKSTNKNSNETSSEDTKNENLNKPSGSEKDNSLSKYSSEEIEYARIWLQLGSNQEIDELNVRHILTGTVLNPDDNTSANYPEDVIQLAGSRLMDGSITYSGNGDGTINIYNVPLRWDGLYPAGENFYTDILKNTKLVYVDPGNDEDIIKIINKINIE